MGRDQRTGRERAARVLAPSSDDDPETPRHAPTATPRPGRWRLTGAPAGAAVAVAAVAVTVSALALGGGGGSEEVLVGPGAGPVSEAATAATAAGSGATAPEGTASSGLDVPAVVVRPRAPGLGVAPTPGPTTPAGTSGASVAAGPLVVHVDGAVARPGVVTVPAGSRVGDAVTAAGGVTDEADTRLVNLARPLADGELVVVPRPGEAGVAGRTGVEGPVVGPGQAPAGPAAEGDGPLDLNTADTAALDALPGIGPVLAERIVAHRDEVGPFTTVDDLEQVPGIGPAVLEDVRDRVRAGPP